MLVENIDSKGERDGNFGEENKDLKNECGEEYQVAGNLIFWTLNCLGPKGAWGKAPTGRAQDYGGGYEEVMGGGGGKSTSRQTEAPRLQLGNKFAALRDGD